METTRWLPIWITLKFSLTALCLTTESDLKSGVYNSMEASFEIKDNDGREDRQNEENIVITNSGPIQGYIHEGTPNIVRFYDIPYGSINAVNPFQEPSPSEPWKNVHNNNEHKSRCPQIEHPDKFIGDTDCLTLNIMVPIEANNSGVLFHIHDGSLNNGSGNPSIYGPEYIVPKGIILVLPNYRLGPLGFLCLRNDTIPGNAALKDLTLALKWIKDNVAAFGGNPLNIVISGEGNAGALAGYLSISPSSRDYVSKVITESGFVLSHWALDRDPLTTVNNLTQKNNYPIDAVTAEYDEFENSSLAALILAAKDMTFAPCIEDGDKSFITKTPWILLNSLKTNILFMIGSTSHAGMQEALQHTESSLSELDEDFGVILPDDLDFQQNEKKSEIANKLKNQYFGNNTVTLDTVEELSLYYTDASYLGPMIRSTRSLVAAGAQVYFYEFAFVGDFNREILSSVKIHGASIGDIARYVFCYEGQIPSDDTKEKYMVEVVTDLWTSFIHTGKPTADKIEWQRVEQTEEPNENWLLIGSEVMPQKGIHVDRLKLWSEIYEMYFIEHNRGFVVTPYVYSLMFTMFLFICLTKILF